MTGAGRDGGGTTQRPGVTEMFRRQLDYWWTVYRRTWKGSAITSFVQPWLYIGAMGVLLGDYIDDGGAGLGGAPSYLAFVAPGLLAATAMQVAVGEVMWPVMGRIKWDRTYHAMIASPLRVLDIVLGHVGYAMFRVTLTTLVFGGVLAVVGLFTTVAGTLVALAAAVLTGLAFAAPVYAVSAGANSDQVFVLIYRLGVMPMFLFSGAFFPISNLDEPLQWVAKLTPLWHGVELCRMGALGVWDLSMLVHVAYLCLFAGVGLWWGVRRLSRRLVV
jgi:lipooligosaccharide transport system permease protein